jgi:hypothetical protein
MTIYFCAFCAYEEDHSLAKYQVDGTILCRKHAISRLKNKTVSSASREQDQQEWRDGRIR